MADTPATKPPTRPPSAERRILALDLGEVRVGVAISDPIGLTAQPVETLPFQGEKALARAVAELCARWDVGEVLVGHPVGTDGRATARAEAAERFARRLEPTIRRRVRLVDERFTTAEAERNLLELGLGRDARRERIDQEAARILLQTELDRRRASPRGP